MIKNTIEQFQSGLLLRFTEPSFAEELVYEGKLWLGPIYSYHGENNNHGKLQKDDLEGAEFYSKPSTEIAVNCKKIDVANLQVYPPRNRTEIHSYQLFLCYKALKSMDRRLSFSRKSKKLWDKLYSNF